MIWLMPGTARSVAEKHVKKRLCAGVVGRCVEVTDAGKPATVYDIELERDLKALRVQWRSGLDGEQVVDGHRFQLFADSSE